MVINLIVGVCIYPLSIFCINLDTCVHNLDCMYPVIEICLPVY